MTGALFSHLNSQRKDETKWTKSTNCGCIHRPTRSFLLLKRCIVTWRQIKAVQTHTKLTVEVFFFYKQSSRQRQSNRFWMSCDAQEQEGGMTDRMMEEDFKLTPLWIFPNTVYYNTVSLNIVWLWKWNQDKAVTEQRNPKEVTISLFLVICFAREAADWKG